MKSKRRNEKGGRGEVNVSKGLVLPRDMGVGPAELILARLRVMVSKGRIKIR